MKRCRPDEYLTRLGIDVGSLDSRFQKQLGEGTHYELTLDDAESFLSLVWLEGDCNRVVASGGPRSLGALAAGMLSRNITFDALLAGTIKPSAHYDPGWFAECSRIYNAF